MNDEKGKIHMVGESQGYDTIRCNGFAAPKYYSAGVTKDWKKVTCKSCLKTRRKK